MVYHSNQENPFGEASLILAIIHLNFVRPKVLGIEITDPWTTKYSWYRNASATHVKVLTLNKTFQTSPKPSLLTN